MPTPRPYPAAAPAAAPVPVPVPSAFPVSALSGFTLALAFILAAAPCVTRAQVPGTILWDYDTGGAVFASPTLAPDGTLYIGSNNNRLYALTPGATGAVERWDFETGDWVDSSAAVGADGTVYVGSWDNRLYAIDPETGDQLWAFEAGSFINASPAIGADGALYVGSADNFFYAINPDGSKRWEFLAADAIECSAALALDGTIYFGCNDGTFYALNPDGTEKWAFTVEAVEGTDPRIYSSPALDPEGNVYFGAGNARFYALQPGGELAWELPVEVVEASDASPAIGPEGNVYFATREGTFFAYSAEGVELWTATLGDIFYSSPVVDRAGNVYIAAFIGQNRTAITCFDSGGAELWTQVINAVIDSSPTLSPDGVLYVGAFDGKLYAIQAGEPLANPGWPRFGRGMRGRRRAATGAAPGFAEEPVSTSGVPGGSISLFASLQGAAPVSVLWRRNGLAIPGAGGPVLTLNGVGRENVGVYDALAYNDVGEQLSDQVFVTLVEPVTMAGSGGAAELHMTYFHPVGFSGVAFGAKGSTDLVDWGTAGLTEEEVSVDADAREVLVVAPMAGQSRRFLRVEITSQ